MAHRLRHPNRGLEWRSKLAVTERLLLKVTVHEPVPLQSPDQPENAEPTLGAAVKVTLVSTAKRLGARGPAVDAARCTTDIATASTSPAHC